jgi:hypothetical protein
VWAELEYCGVRVRYDAAEVDYDFEQPVRGTLTFLAEYGFVDGHDLVDALAWLSRKSIDETLSPISQGWRGAPRSGVRCVIEVIERLRMAGG